MNSSDGLRNFQIVLRKKFMREVKMSHLINVEVSMPKLESSRREVKNYSFLFEEHKKTVEEETFKTKILFPSFISS